MFAPSAPGGTVAGGGGPAPSASAMLAPPPGALLIGSVGKDYVLEALQSRGPDRTIAELQQHRGLRQPLCKPLLGMLDQLQITRLEAHRHVLARAKALLLSKVQALRAADRAADAAGTSGGFGSSGGAFGSSDRAADALEELLAASFPYLGIPDLEEVPLEVLNSMAQVPTPFLKLLAEDREVFNKLPAKVKQQVWAFDKALLQTDAIAYIAAYKYELPVILDALNMHRFVEPQARASQPDAGAAPSTGNTLSTASPGAPNRPGFSLSQKTSVMGAQIAGNLSATRQLPPAGVERGGLVKGRGGGGFNLKPAPLADRRKVRATSSAVRHLKQMVGDSAKVYAHMLELCVVKYKDSTTFYTGPKEASYCSLRTQLVMALHDDQVSARFKDRCHELAWTLDAVIHNKAISEQHLAKLREFFGPYSAAGARKAERLAAKRRADGEGGGGKRRRVQDEWESTGGGSEAEPEGGQVLAEAGMVLRDPPAMHLLAAQVVNELHAAVAACQLPCERPNLGFLLQLMYLAVGAKQMLRETKYYFPAHDEAALGGVWAILAGVLADAELDNGEPSSQERERPFGSMAGWQLLVGALTKDEVVRKVVQMMILERLIGSDLVTARTLLTALRDAQQWTFKQALPEYAPFAWSLADLLQDHLRAQRLDAGSGLWGLAFEQVLLPLVDSDGQVHSEVLRVLLAVAKKVPAATMGAHLENMVIATRGSRERARTQKAKYAEIAKQYMREMGSSVLPGYIGTGGATSEWSDGFNAVRYLKYGTSESFSNLYRQVINITPGLRDSIPERVAQFLRESDEEKQRQQEERDRTQADYDG